jgi:single-stranded-DNA-specific exonuclease
VIQLRTELDAFARSRLTTADFEPVLDVEAELDLSQITPALFQTLSLLEPYGTGNHEPAFIARNVCLLAPPKILKDKHIKLKLKAAEKPEQPELSEVAVLTTPRCHPDGAAIRREEKISTKLNAEKREVRTVFDALGWNMAERLQPCPLLAGDSIDIAFTIGHNDHPDFGGLEFTLRDFKPASTASADAESKFADAALPRG